MSTCTCTVLPMFKPAMRIISAITKSNPASVTTTVDHFYNSGTIVRLVIPESCGMQQINNIVGTITNTGATTFTINIDSTLFDAFNVPLDIYHDPINGVSPHVNTCALVLPIGETTDTLTSATQNVLPY